MQKKYYLMSFPLMVILLGSTYYWQKHKNRDEAFDTSRNVKVAQKGDDLVGGSDLTYTKSIVDASSLAINSSKTNNADIAQETDSYNIDIGGESLTIQFKQHNWDRVDYEFPATAIQMYEELSERSAKGDIAASRALCIKLAMCDDAEKTQASLDERIDVVNQALLYKGSKENFETYGSYEDGQMYIKQLESDYTFCKSISQEKIDERFQFLDLAADGGDYVAARRAKSEHFLAGDVENSFLASWRLWSEFGDMSALGDLGHLIFEGQIPSSFDLKSNFNTDLDNRTLSHALTVLGLKAFAITNESWSSPQAVTLMQVEIGETLDHEASKFSTTEVVNAQAYALELLRSNENCCAVDR